MKNNGVIIIVTVLVTTLAFTHTTEAQIYEYGFKGGLSLAYFTEMEESEELTGVHFGAYLNIHPSLAPMSIQPEFLYTRLGTEISTENDLPSIDPESNSSLKIEYMQIPLLLKYYFPLPGPLDPHMYGGPYIGFKAKVENTPDWNEFSSLEMEETIRDQDYGVMLGLGTDIRLIAATFQVDLRYTYGIQSIFIGEYNSGEKHRAVSVLVGLAF